MENLVMPELEIEGQKFDNFVGFTLRQAFNEHHEFTIRSLDFQDDSTLSLTDFQHNIGKTAILRFASPDETFYEFSGIICEIRLVNNASGSLNELIIIGSSPTIVLESGQHFATFHEKKVDDIVTKIAQSAGLNLKSKTKDNTVLAYKCQYGESTFNFLNRLSADYGECFYYDGKNLIFGQPEKSESIAIKYGEDILSMQLSLRALPVKFSNNDFDEKKDQPLSGKTPDNVTGLGQFSSNIFKSSKQIFSQAVTAPSRNFVDNGTKLDTFNKVQQTAIAANMEVLSVKTFNPKICIGSILKLQVTTFKSGKSGSEDYGEFLVTSIEHSFDGNSNYFNIIEAIPAGLEVIPVKNVFIPVAETQLAIVKDNDDKDKMGRVQVQMLWQTTDGEKTDWISVMTPDAGAGAGKYKKNRGLLCIPEVDDKVMVGFRYNDPDRPFVLGSVFTGKTGEGGGDKNKIKSFITNSGSIIKFEEDAISIIDAKEKSKMLFDGKGKINIESEEQITLKCGQSSISMKKDGTIEVNGNEISISGGNINIKAQKKINVETQTDDLTVKSGMNMELKSTMDTKQEALNMNIKGNLSAKFEGSVTAELSGGVTTTVKGAIVQIN